MPSIAPRLARRAFAALAFGLLALSSNPPPNRAAMRFNATATRTEELRQAVRLAGLRVGAVRERME